MALSASRRVIVILGAGGTLGTALNRQLAAEPDTDLVLSDLSEDALRQARDLTASREVAAGEVAAGEVATVQADISDFAAVENVVKHATDRFGRLDVLISNAGVLSPNGRITTSPPRTGSGPTASTCSARSTASGRPSR